MVFISSSRKDQSLGIRHKRSRSRSRSRSAVKKLRSDDSGEHKSQLVKLFLLLVFCSVYIGRIVWISKSFILCILKLCFDVDCKLFDTVSHRIMILHLPLCL